MIIIWAPTLTKIKFVPISPNNYQESIHYLISPQLKIRGDRWDATLSYSFSEDEVDAKYSNDPNPPTNQISQTELENIDLLLRMLINDRSSLQFGSGYSTSRFLREGNFLIVGSKLMLQ